MFSRSHFPRRFKMAAKIAKLLTRLILLTNFTIIAIRYGSLPKSLHTSDPSYEEWWAQKVKVIKRPVNFREEEYHSRSKRSATDSKTSSNITNWVSHIFLLESIKRLSWLFAIICSIFLQCF